LPMLTGSALAMRAMIARRRGSTKERSVDAVGMGGDLGIQLLDQLDVSPAARLHLRLAIELAEQPADAGFQLVDGHQLRTVVNVEQRAAIPETLLQQAALA